MQEVNVKNILLFCICLVLMANVIAKPIKMQEAMLPFSQASSLSAYMIELPISGYGNIEREQVFVQALKSMLIASSSNQNVINLPAVKTALSKPGLYVRQFNYVSKNNPTNKSSLFLQINFDPKAVDKLLQRASKVVFVNSKPLTLIWLAKDVGTGKILADEAIDDGLVHVLRKKAREMGMSIMLPTLDLQDINNVKVHDICNFNTDIIKAASRRYGTPLIAFGCVKPSILGKMWSSQWLLMQGAKSDRFSFTGDSAESVVTQALQTLANNTANVVTQVSGQGTKVVLRITNVSGLDQCDEVVRYLHDFAKSIAQIDLINISATEVELAISIVGGQQVLLNTLNMQDKLVPNPDVIASPPGIDLDYKWVVS